MKDHPVVSHLVKLRVTMEKLRPLDAKLKYQIDKLLKLAASASKAIASNGYGSQFSGQRRWPQLPARCIEFGKHPPA